MSGGLASKLQKCPLLRFPNKLSSLAYQGSQWWAISAKQRMNSGKNLPDPESNKVLSSVRVLKPKSKYSFSIAKYKHFDPSNASLNFYNTRQRSLMVISCHVKTLRRTSGLKICVSTSAKNKVFEADNRLLIQLLLHL